MLANKYFFILGNNPALSVAEILAWLQRQNINYSNIMAERDFIIIDLDQELSRDSNRELGGVIKFGQVVAEFGNAEAINPEWLVDKMLDIHNAQSNDQSDKSSKFYFGFSIYPRDKQLSFNLRGVGLEVKKILKEYKISSRLVMSKQENLSSVVVQKNKLVTDSGWEIVILKNNNKIFVARTLGVQPFEQLGKRDFGRPDRDDFSGMLPPKLAQMMVNLAAQPIEANIIDAFCGSGTVIQEALLLGYKNVNGFDVSKKAVDDSKENMLWLADEFDIDISKVVIKNIDVKELANNIKNNSVDAVVSEPFLGPPARGFRNRQEIHKIINDLTDLYKKAFINFEKVLKTGGIVVMIFPVFNERNDYNYMPLDKIIDLRKFEKISYLPVDLQQIYRLSKNKNLLYSRVQQKVQREIVIVKKK